MTLSTSPSVNDVKGPLAFDGAGASSEPKLRERSERRDAPAQFLVYALWILMIFEVDQFLAATTGAPFNRLPTLIAPLLTLLTLGAGKRHVVYWPLMIFVAMHLGASVFAENAGLARVPLKFLLYMTLLLASTASFMNTAAKQNRVLQAFLLGFLWYALQGIPNGGRVMWHWLLANEDSFGPLMCLAAPFAYFYSVATTSRPWKWVARVIFGISILGVVVSFARGAAVGAAVSLVYILWRSPNRTKAFVFLMVATIVLIPLVAIFVPLDAYLVELSSSAQGDPVRTHLWGLALRVFSTSPLVGVGAGNFGVIAEMIATPEDQMIVWGSIYFRAIHNATVQILAEEGLIGITVWAVMIFNFFRWNGRLRTRTAVANWRGLGGTDLSLPLITRALDGSMLAFLTTSIFYNQLYIHWFWSLLTFSFVLHRLTIVLPAERGRKARAARSRWLAVARA